MAPVLLGAGRSCDTLQRQLAFVHYPHFPDGVTEAQSYHSVITSYNGKRPEGKLQTQRALVPGHTADVQQSPGTPGWSPGTLTLSGADATSGLIWVMLSAPLEVRRLSAGASCPNWKAETCTASD